MWPFGKKSKTIDQIADELEVGLSGGASGSAVSTRSALEVTTVLACCDTIASAVAVPDLHVMTLKDDARTKERDRKHPAYRVLHRRPNELQTAMEFRYSLTTHAALVGNGYALPTFNTRDELIELIPLMPHWVTVQRKNRYELDYLVHDDHGFVGKFSRKQMFHIKNRSWDLISGLSAVSTARKAIGLSIATEKNIAGLQDNGGKPGGILSTDKALSKEAAERLKQSWEKATGGKNAYKTAVLDNALSYQSMAMTAVDQQTLETRRFQVEEICRAFGVFPQMVMHTDKASTFASSEAFFKASERITGGKWQKNWAEELDEFVLDGAGPNFVEFDNRELQSANLKDRGDYFARALGAGGHHAWLTPNEVRAHEGLAPIKGGDVLPPPANVAKLEGEKGLGSDEKQ